MKKLILIWIFVIFSSVVVGLTVNDVGISGLNYVINSTGIFAGSSSVQPNGYYTFCKTANECDYACTDAECGDELITAINGVSANGGGTLMIVYSSTPYNVTQNVTVPDNMTIIGPARISNEGDNNTFYVTGDYVKIADLNIDASKSTANEVIRVRSRYGAVIDNVEITDAYKHGVKFDHTAPHYENESKVIQNSRIINYCRGTTGFGIYHDYSKGVKILNNMVTGSGCDAIELGNLGQSITMGNTVIGEGERVSINYPFADHSIICNNHLNNAGIVNDANTADNVTICDNLIYNISPAAFYGGIRAYGSDNIITDNQIYLINNDSDKMGIIVFGEAKVSGNRIFGNNTDYGSGIYLSWNGSDVSDNYINNFRRGIFIVRHNNVVKGNTIKYVKNGTVISSSAASGVTALNNTIYNNHYFGVEDTEELPGNSVQLTNNLFEKYNYTSMPNCIKPFERLSIMNATNHKCECFNENWLCVGYS